MAKCKQCGAKGAEYEAGLSRYCNLDHAAKWAYANKAKGYEFKRKDEKRKDVAAKAVSNQTVKHWCKKADTAFQLFIRLRDVGELCISCGKHERDIKHDPRGGKWDGGHYISKGAGAELRYSEDNCHKQCKHCNSGKYLSGNSVKYRVRLIVKIGEHRVGVLEGPHEIPHWKWDDYKAVYEWYNRLNLIIKKEIKECTTD